VKECGEILPAQYDVQNVILLLVLLTQPTQVLLGRKALECFSAEKRQKVALGG